MITVTLTSAEIEARGKALAQYANKLIELAEEEEELKVGHKNSMADINKQRVSVYAELKRLSRAVRLGVEERSNQAPLFDSERARFEAEDDEVAAHEARIEAEEDRAAEESMRLGEHPFSGANTEFDDWQAEWQAEWRASLSSEERERYNAAPCSCGHRRDWHEDDDSDGVCTGLNCGPTIPTAKCTGYHCPDCDTKGGHQATCAHYVLGEGTPVDLESKEPTIEDALRSALHSFEGAADRWQSLIEKGATDDELMAAIGREFGIMGGSSAHGGYEIKGGKKPEFLWNSKFGVKALRGKRLLAKVREGMGIGAPGQPSASDQADDFTAERCDECRRIDGRHTAECSGNPNHLTFEDYLDFAQNGCTGIKNPNAQARKWQLSKEQDGTIREWKRMKAEGKLPQQQAVKKAPKKSKRAKLDPIEAAIDR